MRVCMCARACVLESLYMHQYSHSRTDSCNGWNAMDEPKNCSTLKQYNNEEKSESSNENSYSESSNKNSYGNIYL